MFLETTNLKFEKLIKLLLTEIIIIVFHSENTFLNTPYFLIRHQCLLKHFSSQTSITLVIQ